MEVPGRGPGMLMFLFYRYEIADLFLLIYFRSIICQVVVYGGLKTKENFKFLALKVVAVT